MSGRKIAGKRITAPSAYSISSLSIPHVYQSVAYLMAPGLGPIFRTSLRLKKLPPTSADSKSDLVARTSINMVLAHIKGNSGTTT